jgi:hypothetical protein
MNSDFDGFIARPISRNVANVHGAFNAVNVQGVVNAVNAMDVGLGVSQGRFS